MRITRDNVVLRNVSFEVPQTMLLQIQRHAAANGTSVKGLLTGWLTPLIAAPPVPRAEEAAAE